MTSPRRPARSAAVAREPASGRRSRRPSSWTAARGACSPRSGRTASRRPTTPRSGWPVSPSCSTPRSPTRTAATSSRRRAPACSPQATRPAGAWSGTCTTAPSSGSCTRSSRSSSRSGRSTTTGATPRTLVAEALGTAERATAELRELAHGILPSALTRGGLRAGVEAFAARLDLPVDLDVSRGSAACGHRGQRVLHRRRGAHQRRQARSGDAGDRESSGRGRRAQRSRCATTESAGRIRKATASWASPTGSTRSAAACGSKA